MMIFPHMMIGKLNFLNKSAMPKEITANKFIPKINRPLLHTTTIPPKLIKRESTSSLPTLLKSLKQLRWELDLQMTNNPQCQLHPHQAVLQEVKVEVEVVGLFYSVQLLQSTGPQLEK